MAKLDEEPPFTREVLAPALARVERAVHSLFATLGAYYVCALVAKKEPDPDALRGCIFGHNVPDDFATAVVMATSLAISANKSLAREAFAREMLLPLAREAGKRAKRCLNVSQFDILFVVGAKDPVADGETPGVAIGSTFPSLAQDASLLLHFIQQRRRAPQRYDRTDDVRGRP